MSLFKVVCKPVSGQFSWPPDGEILILYPHKLQQRLKYRQNSAKCRLTLVSSVMQS